MTKYKGSLPSGKVFDTKKEDERKAAKIRKTAATNMSMETSAGDVIGSIAPIVGAAVGAYFGSGNPAAIQAGYQGGKAIGGVVSDKEQREEVFQEASEAEQELEQPSALAKQPGKDDKKKKKKKETEGDAFTQALALYNKFSKDGDKGISN
jgi:FKBP-type peptidyl-prolyl cis-trans isomerase